MSVYTGSCHCGAVRFTAEAELEGLGTCNCSICGRSGMIYLSVPREHFTLLSGQDALTDYQFGPKRIHHPFCRTCGIRVFSDSDGGTSLMVNARCLEGVDVHTLTTASYDGRSL